MPAFSPPPKKTVEVNKELIDTSTQYKKPNNQRVITTIEGTRWKSTFYAQVLKSDDIPRPLDIGIAPTDQQYLKIVDLDLMLTGELSYSEDASTGDRTISGSANVWPGIKVNQYDHFIAEFDNGTKGIFIVKSVEALSYRSKTVRAIEFELFTLWNQQYNDNLEIKTIEIWYFNSETNTVGDTPANGGAVSKTSFASGLGAMYYDLYYNRDCQTFIQPGLKYTYDFFLTKFFLSIVRTDDRLNHPPVTVYDWGNGEYARKIRTVLDLMLNADGSLLRFTSKEVRKVTPREFSSDRVYLSAVNSKIDSLIWPKDVKTLKGSTVPNTEEDYYIFSKAFYDKNYDEMNTIEKMVSELIHKGSYPTWTDLVKEINKGIDTESDDDLFYLIPVYYYLCLFAR